MREIERDIKQVFYVANDGTEFKSRADCSAYEKKRSHEQKSSQPVHSRKNSIKWLMLDAGEYESEDGRFHILHLHDKMYGRHWKLTDRENIEDYSFAIVRGDSLRFCKLVAESRKEKSKNHEK